MSQPSWFKTVFRWRGSVLPAVLPRALVCGLFSLLISLLQQSGLPVHMPALASVIPNVVLGLMLVFRTNTAYERFWEGRKLWGGLINSVRNLARQIWVTIGETNPADRSAKTATLYLLVAFGVATKLHLRQEAINSELERLLSRSQWTKLQGMNNPPLEIALWIQDYLQQQYRRGQVDVFQLGVMQTLLNHLVDYLGGCERILRTPIPLAYAIHLKQLLLLYCLTLPFQFVDQLQWWTGPVVTLISFSLLGIEEIGIEIENPFGRDANDLPLDAICATMKRNIDDLIAIGTALPWDSDDLDSPDLGSDKSTYDGIAPR